MRTNTLVITLLSVALLFLLFGLFSHVQQLQYTGYATTFNATTTANIANYFAINASANLSADGIIFTIPSLPSYATNATANYFNATNNGTFSEFNETRLFLTVEYDSNVNVDFCIRANASLYSGANFINISNYTFANATVNNISFPAFNNQRRLTENGTFLDSSKNRGQNQMDFYRFWLNVSGSQAAGTYTNQINFKGIQTGGSC